MSARYFTDESERVTKKCVICGKDFVCNNSTAVRTRKYCSEKCKLLAIKSRKENGTVVPRGPRRNKLSFVEITKRAKEKGLSYGQYVSKYGCYDDGGK